MKNLKRILALTLAASFLFTASCSTLSRTRNHSDRDEDKEEDSGEDPEIYETDWGTFEITHGWVYVPSQSNDEAYCFCEAGNENSSTPPNNIVVRHGDNYYSPEESSTFAIAILDQVEQQAQQYGGTARMESSGTINGNDYYRFILDCTPYTEQYYFIGDHEFVMVGVCVYDEDEAEDDHIWDVSEDILNSFEWPD
ncbi:MAG: hypothetical protein K6F79_03350 [Saccharofermentans sp.]|nr:hypothetical protein [Saccharofermentans sp.]